MSSTLAESVRLLLVALAVAQLVQAQTYSVLHSFSVVDGSTPYAGMIQDGAGNLYGTTLYGGAFNAGTVFKVDPTGNHTVLHHFGEGTDGANPFAGLMRDSKGNLYGATIAGGTFDWGTVFKLDTTGKETVLHSFTGTRDGGRPYAGVIRDSAGTLYGITTNGKYNRRGTVFKLDKNGILTVLHRFIKDEDGANPYGSLIRDHEGNLYGTTYRGGAFGEGTIFKLDRTGKEIALYSFTGGPEGAEPYASLMRSATGDLYSTAIEGGDFDKGTVFKLDMSGQITALHSFEGSDGMAPWGALIRDSRGNLYGTTQNGGAFKAGTVFKLPKGGKAIVLYSFTGGDDGAFPTSGLLRDSAGNLYGTTRAGGNNNSGVVFKLTP